MDVETCWKWFNEVFYPEVKKRTHQQVLLLLDNSPAHFDAFERDGVRVVFFPPNCTSWKQPCNMGIIAALKKRYKYLYLIDIFDHYELGEDIKTQIQNQAKRLQRGSAGVSYGHPAHLLDAATHVKQAWDDISSATIKNAFNKAEIMEIESSTSNEPDVLCKEVLSYFALLNIAMDRTELQGYEHVDDESNEYNTQVNMEKVEEVLHNIQIDEDDDDDKSEDAHAAIDQLCPEQPGFVGADQLIHHVVYMNNQLLCKDTQVLAGLEYKALCSLFEVFQKKVAPSGSENQAQAAEKHAANDIA
jgi:DDE superfamily endonuclease